MAEVEKQIQNGNWMMAKLRAYVNFQTVVAVLVAVCFALGLSGTWGLLGMPLTAQIAFTILLVAALLWITEAVPLFVTSLIVLWLALIWLLPALPKEIRDDTLFLAPFFDDVILLFLGGFVLSAGLNRYGLDEQLARRILQRAGGSVSTLILSVMAVTAFLSMWLSNTASAAMMLTLVYPISNRLPTGDPGRKALLLSIPFSANLGGMGTPIGTPPIAIAVTYLEKIGKQPTFLEWMLIGVPSVILFTLLAWGLLLWFYPPKSQAVPPLETTDEPMTWNFQIYALLTVAGITVFGWMTSSVHGLSSGQVALIPVLAYFGMGLLKVHDLRSLAWDVLLLMGGGLCLGAVISNSDLDKWLIAQLPIDQLSNYGLLALFGVVAVGMSSVMSNTATANLILPIILGMQGQEQAPLMIMVAFACSLAMPLPISTPPNAMAFSSGEITVQEMLKPGLTITILTMVVTLTAGLWWWRLCGFA